MWPNHLNDLDTDEDEDDEEPEVKWPQGVGKGIEMGGLNGPKTPMASGAVPFTPRTQAYHILDRKLPLRQ
jgi:hypothetical protein